MACVFGIDGQVTPPSSFCDEEKELDRKLNKRKRELLEVVLLPQCDA